MWAASGAGISGEGDGVSAGDGGAWAVWLALSTMRREGAADSVCGQRDELLRAVPDWREGAGGSEFVEVVAGGLAADVGGVGGVEEKMTSKARRTEIAVGAGLDGLGL